MGGAGLPPELMKEKGVGVLLCKDLGLRAINLCKELGIDVYTCQADTVRDIFRIWQEKKINKAGPQDACQQDKA
jgi:predicted Fe-Mo cluster-binding NifX family protein